jgi:hypothetical protein
MTPPQAVGMVTPSMVLGTSSAGGTEVAVGDVIGGGSETAAPTLPVVPLAAAAAGHTIGGGSTATPLPPPAVPLVAAAAGHIIGGSLTAALPVAPPATAAGDATGVGLEVTAPPHPMAAGLARGSLETMGPHPSHSTSSQDGAPVEGDISATDSPYPHNKSPSSLTDLGFPTLAGFHLSVWNRLLLCAEVCGKSPCSHSILCTCDLTSTFSLS